MSENKEHSETELPKKAKIEATKTKKDNATEPEKKITALARTFP